MSGAMPTMQQMSAPQMSPLPPGPGAPSGPGNMPVPRSPMMPPMGPQGNPSMPPGGNPPPMPQQLQAQASVLQPQAPQLIGGVGSPPAQQPGARNVPIHNLALLGKAGSPQMRADNVSDQNPSSKLRLTPAELARLGRFGDTIVAHLTPGEIAVPPQVQSPQLMQMLQQAFQAAHVDVAQFTAGSPKSSINPQTGVPEYNFLSALLPIIGGLAGTFLLPGLGTDIGAGLGGAIGGGLGGVAGGLLNGGGLGGALEGGALGALGGWGAGSFLPGLVGAGAGASTVAGAGTSDLSSLATIGDNTGGAAAGVASGAGTGSTLPVMPASSTSGVANPWDSATSSGPSGTSSTASVNNSSDIGSWLAKNKSWLPLAIGGLGAILAATQGSQTAPMPAGFSTPLAPRNPNPNALLGNGANATPQFAGYNPITSVTQRPFNFYTPAANG